MNVMVLYGSAREGRKGEVVGEWVRNYLISRPELTIDYVDAASLQLPFFDEAAPIGYLNGEFKHDAGKAWGERVAKADAFVFITPEYNHGIPAVLKNAIDYAWEGWHYKPVSFVGYSGGPSGGHRSVEQLRLTALGVKLLPLYNAVQIPFLGSSFDTSGNPVEDRLQNDLQGLADELITMAGRLKSA